MRTVGHLLAFIALASSMPLSAAPDTGLVLHDTGIGQRGTGIGVSTGVTIKLGPDRIVKDSERVKLGIAAGPVFTLRSATARNGVVRGNPSLVGLEIRPGYASSINLAGQPLMTRYTLLGAAEKDEDDDSQGTGDKVAWVAAVAGGVMVLLVGAATIALMTECYECGD